MSKFHNGNSRAGRLTAEQVIEIRQKYLNEQVTQGTLSRMYGVTIGTIGRIVRGESWQHVSMPENTQEIRDAAAESFARLRAMLEISQPGTNGDDNGKATGND